MENPRTPWNCDLPLMHMDGAHELRKSLKAFEDKIHGHILREFRYRAFAAHVLKQLEGLKNVVPEPTGPLLDRAVEAWKVELDEIGKL